MNLVFCSLLHEGNRRKDSSNMYNGHEWKERVLLIVIHKKETFNDIDYMGITDIKILKLV